MVKTMQKFGTNTDPNGKGTMLCHKFCVNRNQMNTQITETMSCLSHKCMHRNIHIAIQCCVTLKYSASEHPHFLLQKHISQSTQRSPWPLPGLQLSRSTSPRFKFIAQEIHFNYENLAGRRITQLTTLDTFWSSFIQDSHIFKYETCGSESETRMKEWCFSVFLNTFCKSPAIYGCWIYPDGSYPIC